MRNDRRKRIMTLSVLVVGVLVALKAPLSIIYFVQDSGTWNSGRETTAWDGFTIYAVFIGISSTGFIS